MAVEAVSERDRGLPIPAELPLTIGDLAESTGVPTATLRSWEQRFGFPDPDRSSGGQRRYSDRHVDQVRRVLAARERGLGLAAAIAATLQGQAPRTTFADLRARHPQLDVMTVGVPVMRALTQAMEDECLAHASGPLLIGCFQDEASFERAGRRWRELARGARRAVVLSDFQRSTARGGPERVVLPPDSPLLSEWGLVCEDPRLSVALVGWERPPARRGARRVFEALVSTDPAVVRDAAARYVAAAREFGLADPDDLMPTAAAGDADRDREMSLLRRFAAYSDR